MLILEYLKRNWDEILYNLCMLVVVVVQGKIDPGDFFGNQIHCTPLREMQDLKKQVFHCQVNQVLKFPPKKIFPIV